jgi:hypothetical protein
MNPPLFDEHRESIFHDDHSGSVHEFTLDGVSKGVVLHYQCRERTAIAYDESQQRFLTTNTTQGAILWNASGSTNSRYLIGISASLALYFISNEYAVMLDAKSAVILIDFVTSHTSTVFVAPDRVNRFFFFKTPQPHCVLCCRGDVIILTFVLCWSHWYTTLSRPVSITRQPKANEAARIAVMCSNAQITLLSPRNGGPLTGITSMDLSTPYFFFYDRGTYLLPDVNRDRAFVPFYDGVLRIFSTGQNPCAQIAAVDLRVTALCECIYKQQLCFCFGTAAGYLLMYEYESLRPVGRVVACQNEIIALAYRPREDSIIIVYRERVFRYSFAMAKLMEFINFPGRRVYVDVDGVLSCAQSDGTIACVHLHHGVLALPETHGLLLHDQEITGLSIASNFVITSSLDHKLCIWAKGFLRICQLVFPIPLYSCCVLNGRRDILVATDAEIMKVAWSWVSDEVDPEDEFWDNYDKKFDFLCDEGGFVPWEEKRRSVLDRPPRVPVVVKQQPSRPTIRKKGAIAALEKREREKAEALAAVLQSLSEQDKVALERSERTKIVDSMSQVKKEPARALPSVRQPAPMENAQKAEKKGESVDEEDEEDDIEDDDSRMAAAERLTTFLMGTSQPLEPDTLLYTPEDYEEPEQEVESAEDRSLSEPSEDEASENEASVVHTPGRSTPLASVPTTPAVVAPVPVNPSVIRIPAKETTVPIPMPADDPRIRD